jgi:hypothetical protein
MGSEVARKDALDGPGAKEELVEMATSSGHCYTQGHVND